MKASSLLIYFANVTAFCPSHRVINRTIHRPRARLSRSRLQLTTEEDVIKLVEKAETLWAEAYKARTIANELSERAQALGVSAEESASEATANLQTSVSLSKISDAQIAQNLSLDLGALVEQAKQAQDEADAIEKMADVALKESEVALEQHLIDFPENA